MNLLKQDHLLHSSSCNPSPNLLRRHNNCVWNSSSVKLTIMNMGSVRCNTVTGRVFQGPCPLRLQGLEVRWETHQPHYFLTHCSSWTARLFWTLDWEVFPKCHWLASNLHHVPCQKSSDGELNPYSKLIQIRDQKTLCKAHFNFDNPNHIWHLRREQNVRNTQTLFSENTRKLYSSFSNFYVKNTQVFQYRRVHVCSVNTIKQIHNKS